MDKDDYFLRHYSDIDSKNHKRFELSKGTPYTLTEAFRINQLALESPDRSKSATFWKDIEFKGLLPGRTCESLRNFLKVQLKYGIMEYYKEHVQSVKYSHYFDKILKVKPVPA